jgi:hypothetical protein
MGYAHYTVSRRGELIEAGYGVEDVCNDKDCGEEIDRGLGYLCGATPGGDEYGCGGYFCGGHLFSSMVDDVPQLCGSCSAKARARRLAEFSDQIAEAIKALAGVTDAAVLADKPEILVDMEDGDQIILTLS